MAYADQKAGGNRVVALIIVGIIHVIIGYAFVSGLAYEYVKKAQEELNVIDITEPPPPPEEVPPPPPPPDSASPPPPQTTVVVQQPIVRVPVPSPPIRTTDIIPDFQPTIPPTPPAPPTPPTPPAPPAPPREAKGLQARNAGGWITDADYPAGAQREGLTGVTRFRLQVDASGRATSCEVTGSSGHRILDDQACRLLPRRARFTPAEDASGNRIPSTYASSIRWTVPD